MVGGVIGISLLASYFLFLHPSQPPIQSISEKPKIEETLPPPPQIADTTSAPEEKQEKPFSLQLKAIEKTWVRIQINGQPENEMTLNPGETVSHQALNRIHLLVGNVGGLDIIFNGKSLEKFGRSGEVANLTFTSQGVEAKHLEKPKPKPE